MSKNYKHANKKNYRPLRIKVGKKYLNKSENTHTWTSSDGCSNKEIQIKQRIGTPF